MAHKSTHFFVVAVSIDSPMSVQVPQKAYMHPDNILDRRIGHCHRSYLLDGAEGGEVGLEQRRVGLLRQTAHEYFPAWKMTRKSYLIHSSTSNTIRSFNNSFIHSFFPVRTTCSLVLCRRYPTCAWESPDEHLTYCRSTPTVLYTKDRHRQRGKITDR